MPFACDSFGNPSGQSLRFSEKHVQSTLFATNYLLETIAVFSEVRVGNDSNPEKLPSFRKLMRDPLKVLSETVEDAENGRLSGGAKARTKKSGSLLRGSRKNTVNGRRKTAD